MTNFMNRIRNCFPVSEKILLLFKKAEEYISVLRNNKQVTQQDRFFINEILDDTVTAGIFSALAGEFCYFDSDNILYKLHKDRLKDQGAQLSDAKIVKIPEGKIHGLMTFNDTLYLILNKSSISNIYALKDECWEHIGAIQASSPIRQWCISESEAWLIFCESSPAATCIPLYALDKENILHHAAEISIKAKEVNTIWEENGCVHVALSSPHVALTGKMFDADTLMPSAQISFQTELTFSPYRALPSRSKILFCTNGTTQVVDEEQNILFADTLPGESGFQTAAAVFMPGQHEYHFLGTWRRSEEHPSACFYVLKNLQQVYKHIDHLELSEDNLKWTGYFNADHSLRTHEHAFFPCFGSSALYVCKLDNKDFSILNSAPVLYSDEQTLILGHVAPPKINAEKTAPKAKQHKQDIKTILSQSQAKCFETDKGIRPHNYGGYYCQPPAQKFCRVYLTFDIEQHVKGNPYCLTGKVFDQECGIYWIMDQLEKFALKGVFFVNIYEHVNFENNIIEKIVKDIDERGHEVGLHCHASSLPFNKKDLPYCSKEEQRTIISYGKEFIKSITGKSPVSFRAGGYKLNRDTLTILEELGFNIDSSLFLRFQQKNMSYKSKNQPVHYGKILEIPVTTHAVSGSLSKIDINWHPDLRALIDILQACRQSGLNDLVFMGHSFSFLKFTKAENKNAVDGFIFTCGRYVRGVRHELMKTFSEFLQWISEQTEFSVCRMCDIMEETDIGQSSDRIPYHAPPSLAKTLCPLCGHIVTFEPYRARINALCPVCNSLERVRFKTLYLKLVAKIETENLSVLHIGPHHAVSIWLKSLSNIDYISADPFNVADFDFPIEAIPFSNNSFNLIICVGVLVHVLDDHAAIAEMYRVLTVGGELLLWIGDLEREVTEEHYNREEFKQMVAHNFSYPADLHKPVVERNGETILYNPRYSTRKYGRDFLQVLSDFGFEYKIVKTSDIVASPEFYAISQNDFFVSCVKR